MQGIVLRRRIYRREILSVLIRYRAFRLLYPHFKPKTKRRSRKSLQKSRQHFILKLPSMKKIFAIAVLFFAISMGANAQNKTLSINLGFAPVGHIHESVALKPEKYKYDYNSYINFNLGIEKQFKGVTSLSEFKYAKAKFDSYDLDGESQWFNPRQVDDLYSISFTQYAGHTINANKRIQFPLYIGIGAEYINGGLFHNLLVDGAVKARVKFFITNHIGIYAGGTGRVGWGAKSASESNSSNKDMYSIWNIQWSADAGLTIGL